MEGKFKYGVTYCLANMTLKAHTLSNSSDETKESAQKNYKGIEHGPKLKNPPRFIASSC
jgi:hypothetical protein